MRPEIIGSIGFFHCVDFRSPVDPVARLAEALDQKARRKGESDQAWDISNSLIVLPEGFNVGEYPPRGHSSGEQSERQVQRFLGELGGLAKKYQAMFVAGVLEARRNSAYLVDASSLHLMCHKVGDDRTADYDPCTGDADPCNPVAFSNACVGTLICMDAVNDGNRLIEYRRNRLLNRLKEYDANKILCVPSRFLSDNPNRLPRLPNVPNLWYIVADGLWKRERNDSQIIDSLLRPKIEASNGNEIKIWKLPKHPASYGEDFNATERSI